MRCWRRRDGGSYLGGKSANLRDMSFHQLTVYKCTHHKLFFCEKSGNITGFIRGTLRGVRYAKSLRVLFLHRRSPSWTTLVLYSRAVFIFNEPTIWLSIRSCTSGQCGACSQVLCYQVLVLPIALRLTKNINNAA